MSETYDVVDAEIADDFTEDLGPHSVPAGGYTSVGTNEKPGEYRSYQSQVWWRTPYVAHLERSNAGLGAVVCNCPTTGTDRPAMLNSDGSVWICQRLEGEDCGFYLPVHETMQARVATKTGPLGTSIAASLGGVAPPRPDTVPHTQPLPKVAQVPMAEAIPVPVEALTDEELLVALESRCHFVVKRYGRVMSLRFARFMAARRDIAIWTLESAKALWQPFCDSIANEPEAAAVSTAAVS